MENHTQPASRDIPQATLDRREALNLLVPYRERIARWQVDAARLRAAADYRALAPDQVRQLDALLREIANGRRELRTELQNEGRTLRHSSLVRDTLKAIESAHRAAASILRPR